MCARALQYTMNGTGIWNWFQDLRLYLRSPFVAEVNLRPISGEPFEWRTALEQTERRLGAPSRPTECSKAAAHYKDRYGVLIS